MKNIPRHIHTFEHEHGTMDTSKLPRHMRAINQAHVDQIRERTASGRYALTSSEEWWRDRCAVLEDHGYQLRARLRPGWIPSWSDNDLNPAYCEDSLPSFNIKVVDAVRMSDGKDVAIMQLRRTSLELTVLMHVVDAQKASGKNQHIAPVIDSFQDDREPSLEFLVMPMFRVCYIEPYCCVSEVVHLYKQLLEGLVFMHSIGVAHRDCQDGNIMMDAPSMFPNGFHPTQSVRDRSGINFLETKPRYKAKGPIEYYFIDFGISRMFSPNAKRAVLGNDGADRDVPELSLLEVYDPFPVDVFILGNLLKKRFLSEYRNLTFLRPLVDAMTVRDPKSRPTAEAALKQFNSIINSQSIFTLRRLLVSKDEKKKVASAVYEDVGILLSVTFIPIRLVIGTPSKLLRAVKAISKNNERMTD